MCTSAGARGRTSQLTDEALNVLVEAVVAILVFFGLVHAERCCLVVDRLAIGLGRRANVHDRSACRVHKADVRRRGRILPVRDLACLVTMSPGLRQRVRRLLSSLATQTHCATARNETNEQRRAGIVSAGAECVPDMRGLAEIEPTKMRPPSSAQTAAPACSSKWIATTRNRASVSSSPLVLSSRGRSARVVTSQQRMRPSAWPLRRSTADRASAARTITRSVSALQMRACPFVFEAD